MISLTPSPNALDLSSLHLWISTAQRLAALALVAVHKASRAKRVTAIVTDEEELG